MNGCNRLLALLDTTLGFPNKIRSHVKKKWQAFDQRTGEHVFVLEYRIKVKPGIEPPEKPPKYLRDLHAKRPLNPARARVQTEQLAAIRELLQVDSLDNPDVLVVPFRAEGQR